MTFACRMARRTPTRLPHAERLARKLPPQLGYLSQTQTFEASPTRTVYRYGPRCLSLLGDYLHASQLPAFLIALAPVRSPVRNRRIAQPYLRSKLRPCGPRPPLLFQIALQDVAYLTRKRPMPFLSRRDHQRR